MSKWPSRSYHSTPPSHPPNPRFGRRHFTAAFSITITPTCQLDTAIYLDRFGLLFRTTLRESLIADVKWLQKLESLRLNETSVQVTSAITQLQLVLSLR